MQPRKRQTATPTAAEASDKGDGKTMKNDPSATPAAHAMEHGRGPLKVFGLDLTSSSQGTQLGVLAMGAILCATLFASLQEQVFHIADIKPYGGFVALLQTLTYAACAFIEMKIMGAKRKGKLKDYAILCTLTQGGMLFTNWSLAYLTYPTRVIFKSSKVIPVMIMGVIIMKRSYSVTQYLVASLLAGGIAIFTVGDKSPDFTMVGIALISLGVACDAATSNFEEDRFFHKLRCPQSEVVLYSSAFGAVLALVLLGGSGELAAGLGVSAEHPEVYSLTVMSSVMGYLSVAFVLMLIKHFGATAAEVVKSCRKVVTLALSFIIYSKPMNRNHVLGLTLFVASIVGGVILKSRKDKAKKAAAAAAAAGNGPKP